MKRSRTVQGVPPADVVEKKHIAAFALVVFFLTMAAYYPVLNHTFHLWDDDVYITANQHVLKGLSSDNLKWAFSTTYFGFYYPLTWLSHMADVQFYGLDPRGHYLTSVVLHSLNAAMLFLFLFLSTKNRIKSLCVTALFALHPMNVESVAWLAERKNLLSVFFLLLAMICYVSLVNARRAGKKWSFILMISLCVLYAMGLMSKSSIVMFPLLLLLMDIWPLGRITFGRRDEQGAAFLKLAAEKTPLFVLSIISGILTIIAQKEINTVASLADLSISQRIGSALLGYGFYLQKLFLPFNLCSFYLHRQGSMPVEIVLLVLVVLVVVTVLFLKKRRAAPQLISGWLFFLVSLIPVIGLMQVGSQAYADRYAYFPYWGLFVVLVYGIDWRKIVKDHPWKKGALSSLFLAVITGAFLLARGQAETWKDDKALFSNMIKVSPGCSTGYVKLGDYYNNEKNYDEALSCYMKAYENKTMEISYSIGLTYDKLKKPEKALEFLDIVTRLNPGMGAAYYHKGRILAGLGRNEESIGNLEMALKCGYDSLQVQDMMKKARLNILAQRIKDYFGRQMWREAEEAARQVLKRYPEEADAWCLLGYALKKQNDLEGARNAYQNALDRDISLDEAVYEIALIELQKKEYKEAGANLKVLEKLNSPLAGELRKSVEKK